MSLKNSTIRVLTLLKSHKKEALVLLFLIILTSLFDLVAPFISQKLIDRLISFFTAGGEAPFTLLIFSAIGILVATIFGRVSRAIYDYRIFKLTTRVEDKTRYESFEKYLRLHVLFHHGVSSGQIIGRIERGATALYAIIHDVFGHHLFPPLVMFAGVIATLLIKNPFVALVVFLPLPIYIFVIQHYSNRIYEIEREANEKFEAVSKEGYDVASNVLTVKKFSQEHAETKKQIRLQASARETQYRAEKLWSIIESIQTAIATTGRLGVILVSGFLVLRGESTIGEFVLYITLQNMAYTPLSQLSTILPRLRRNLARAERLFEILDEPIHVVDKLGAAKLPPLAKSIEFKNVWFRYRDQGNWALKGLNLEIPVNTTVALVGRSGSGKTTFINLLLRSFDPQKGAILIDGIDIRDITQESLRNQIAVVPQEVDLFSRSIRQNIIYGKENVNDEELVEAAKTALAHDFIIHLEYGYETVVGERGIRLSGGERQRVGIARAVLRDPRILILDEATSHLDTESERLIQQATKMLMQNRTSFIIAHRLSTILHADLILVFSNGEIEAVGPHEKLLTQSPTYQRLYSLQFREIE